MVVLADALSYADLRLKPDVIVDIATLTGAATLALGRRYGALFSNDEHLAAAIERAGEASNDKLWRMPLAQEYLPELDSSVADLSHVGTKSVGAGAILAALFLEQFLGGRRWAHLDIAGPARAEKSAREVSRGATGFGVRALLRWLEQAPALW